MKKSKVKLTQDFFDKAFERNKNKPIYAKSPAYSCSSDTFYEAFGFPELMSKNKGKNERQT